MSCQNSIKSTARTNWGSWFYEQMQSQVFFESSGWAIERVERVSQRLQDKSNEHSKMKVVVPWLEFLSAFTVPGNYIYFSRRLLEVWCDDEMAAFVIAHEIAHHDLGHLDIFPDWLMELTGEHIGPFITMLSKKLEQRLYGPQWECEADKYAIDLCKAAGYDLTKCIAIFDILEKIAIDYGDLDIVFGPQENDDELSEDASITTKFRIWAFQMKRGYLPIRDRRQMLIEYIESAA